MSVAALKDKPIISTTPINPATHFTTKLEIVIMSPRSDGSGIRTCIFPLRKGRPNI